MQEAPPEVSIFASPATQPRGGSSTITISVSASGTTSFAVSSSAGGLGEFTSPHDDRERHVGVRERVVHAHRQLRLGRLGDCHHHCHATGAGVATVRSVSVDARTVTPFVRFSFEGAAAVGQPMKVHMTVHAVGASFLDAQCLGGDAQQDERQRRRRVHGDDHVRPVHVRSEGLHLLSDRERRAGRNGRDLERRVRHYGELAALSRR